MFGCNLFATYEMDEGSDKEVAESEASLSHPIFINKEMVFGDAPLMVEWSDRHSHPNCADNGWECFAVVSEFDYLFVCTDENSLYFGATRWIINNCDHDSIFTNPPFGSFFERLEAYAIAREAYGDDHDAMLENLDFLKFMPHLKEPEFFGKDDDEYHHMSN